MKPRRLLWTLITLWTLLAMLLPHAALAAPAASPLAAEPVAVAASEAVAASALELPALAAGFAAESSALMTMLPEQSVAAAPSSGDECIPVIFVPGITGSPNTFPFNSPEQPLLRLLQANGYEEGKTLFRFSYNWLNSNNSSAANLASYIEQVKNGIENRIGVRPERVSIVAHSMGGFVTRIYMAGNQDSVDRAVTIGSPYAGSAEMIARWTRWSSFMSGPAELLPTWQTVFDPAGNPVANNAGYGYNPWVQANVWGAPRPDIAFYSTQYDTAHTVTLTEFQVWDPQMGPRTEYRWDRRDYLPGDETVDRLSAITSAGATRIVSGNHAGAILSFNRGGGGVVESAAPQVLSHLKGSSRGGPENCYPYKLEIEITPPQTDIPACVPVNFEVKVLNRETGEPVDSLRNSETLEIKISGSAFQRDTTQRTTDPIYSGATPAVKRPGGVTIEAKVTFLAVLGRSVYTETRAKHVETGSVGLKQAPTRRDRCGRLETATFDENRCDWKWPNSNTPCLPDDNRSAANPGVQQLAVVDTGGSGKIAVLGNGFDGALLAMLTQLNFQAERVAPDFSPEIANLYPVLAIPSGGLSGYAQSELMRQRLEQYVAAGGVIVAFAQEYGQEFGLLPGGPIQGYGYDEDINCQANSSRIVTFAPMLLSQPRELLSINVDGFFTDWPRDATVLLNRTANGMPSMLAYPVGPGYVLATTTYADMARYQGQSTADELRLVRDLMTWALNPALELDRYGPGDTVTIPLAATNTTTATTAFIDFAIANQLGDWVTSSGAIATSLSPGETRLLSTTIPMADLLALNQNQHGQWRVGVGLLDDAGQAVTGQTETYRFASARFTQAESGHGYAGQPYALSVTSESEEYPHNSPATFTYNIFNHSAEERTFVVSWYMIHHSWYRVPGYQGQATVTVPARSFRTVDGLLERVVDLDRVRATLLLNGQRVAYAERGFWVVPAQITQVVGSDKAEYNWGDTPTITVTTTNRANVAAPVIANVAVKAPDGSIHQAEPVSFELGPQATYVFSLPLPALTKPGQHSVSVENLVHGRLAQRSARSLTLPPLRAEVTPLLPASLTPGAELTVRTTNVGSSALPASALQISLAGPAGETLWSAERVVPPLDRGQAHEQLLTLDVPPIDALGDYVLAYEVFGADQSLGKGKMTLPARLALSTQLDRGAYRVREDGVLTASLQNTGRFDLAPTLLVSSPALGLSDSQLLTLAGGDSATLAFPFAVAASVPAGGHVIDVSYQLGSASRNQPQTVVVPPARVLPSLDVTQAAAGDTINVELANPGGVDAPVQANLALTDRFGSAIAAGVESAVIPAGGSVTLALTIPGGAVSGGYAFSLSGSDTATGQVFGLRREISVDGVGGLLTVLTDAPNYFTDQNVTALATLIPDGAPIVNGSIDLKICTPVLVVEDEPVPTAARVLQLPDPAPASEPLDSSRPDGSPKNRDQTIGRAVAPEVVTYTPITGDPLQINVANDASYQVIYFSELGTPGQVYWTFGNTADAGIFLWYDGYVIGPDFWNHPDPSAANYYDPWATVSQGAVTGNGTQNSPWTVETNLVHAPSGATLTTRNSYVNGDNYFRLDWDICLPQPAQISTFLAADYYLQGSDSGYGLYDPMSGSVGGYNVRQDWFQIFTPIRPATHHYAARYWEVWQAIGWAGQPGPGFNDTINTGLVDNGGGLQWDLFVNGCATVNAFWSFGETPTIPPVPPSYQDTCGYVLWETTLPVSTASQLDLSAAAGALDVTGRLLLWGKANSSTGQVIATDQYPFYVFDRDTALTLETDRAVYRPGETVLINGAVTNTSDLTQELTLVVSANETELLVEDLTLAPAQSYSYASSVAASMPLTLTATAANARTSLTPVVALPQVEAELLAPDVVSRVPFSVTLLVNNTGIVPAIVEVTLAGQPEPALSLQPGETAAIERTQQISEDTTITAVLGGDASLTLARLVQQGEHAELALLAPDAPLWAGPAAFPYTLSNTGILPIQQAISFALDGEQVFLREAVVLPGDSLSDVLWLDLAPGEHDLTASTPYQEATVSVTALARDVVVVRIDQIDAPPILAGSETVTVSLTNVGAAPAAGTLVLDAGFDLAEALFDLAPDETAALALALDSSRAAESGMYMLHAQAWSNGALLDEAQQPVEVPAPAWEVEPPVEWFLTPGADVVATYFVRNTGGLGAPFTLVLDLDGLYDDVQSGWADPGQTVPVTFLINVPADLEERQGAGRYVINGQQTEFTYRIAGLELDMAGLLSALSAAPGDPLQVTVDIFDLSDQGEAIPLHVRLTGVGEEQIRPISLTNSAQVVFEIMAPERDALLSYGLYSPTGRSLLLDTLRLYVVGDADGQRPLGVFPDQAVYQPGDVVRLTVLSHVAGILDLRFLGLQQPLSIAAGAPVSIDLPLPADLLAGTYEAAYRFTSVDGRVVDDAAAFEVEGERAALRQVIMDVQADACYGQVGATVKIEARGEMAGVSLFWQVLAPDGQPAGPEQALDGDLPAGVSWWTLPASSFSSTQAGPHQLSLRLVQGERDLAAGFQVFDLGNAALLGIATSKATYRTTEQASATVSLVNNSSDPVTLIVELDGQPFTTRVIDRSGYIVETIDLGLLPADQHTITALLVGSDACTSRAEALVDVAPPPALEIISDQPTGLRAWHVVTPTIYLRAEDTVSTIAEGFYAWEGDVQRRFDGNALAAPFDGELVLSAQVTANDGALSDVVTQTLRIDRQAPEVFATIVESPQFVVILEATDETSGIDWRMYRIDGGEWISYTTPIPITASQPTTVTLDYRARDMAGNWSATGTVTVQIDTAVCDLYPIALHQSTVVGLPAGAALNDMLNGDGPGNFGWLSWAGSPSATALAASLTPPGNSATYVNPYDPDDHSVSVGDWVAGAPGVNNSAAIRAALDSLIGLPITVPVWDAVQGQGSNEQYRVAGYAQVSITGYSLPGRNRISAVYLGPASCTQ